MVSSSLRNILFALFLIIRSVTANVPSAAIVAKANSQSNLTAAVNVPSNSSDELFFHFVGPADQQWAAFGFGSGMANSLIFVIYAQENNSGVTISPRLGKGHTMPQFTDSVKVDVLPGSGIIADTFIANFRCMGCRNNSAIDVSRNQQPVIWAVGKSDVQIRSNDPNYNIGIHLVHGQSELDLKAATGEGGVPVLEPGNGAITTAVATPSTESRFMIQVHAFFAIVAFLVVFPGGYLFLRLMEKVWIHMVIQTVGLILVLVTFILGIFISKVKDISPKLDKPHQIIGILVFVLTFAAWTIGLVGHQLFKKRGVPTIPTKVHRGLGPTAILMGLINVGIGFAFADNAKRAIPFYFAALFVLVFTSGIILLVNRRRMRRGAMQTPAAQNFNNAWYQSSKPPPAHSGNPGFAQPGVPLQNIPLPAQGRPTSVVHPGTRVSR